MTTTSKAAMVGIQEGDEDMRELHGTILITSDGTTGRRHDQKNSGDFMTAQNAGSAQDIDFTIGFIAVILAGCLTVYDLYLAYTTKEIIWILFATAMLFYALFAPVSFSKIFDGNQWTLSKWGNSIWSAIMWRIYMKNIRSNLNASL